MRASFVLAGVALAFATPAAAQELVNNGGFEAGNFAGWTQSGNTGFTGVGAFAANTGSFGAFFGPINSIGTITQTLATNAGQSYLISFDLRNRSGGTPNSYNVSFGGISLFGVTNGPAFGYTNFSTTATAAGASTNLAFSFQHNPSFFDLDNISVTAVNGAVPEPTTWAMMLIGFLALGAAMRRRRQITETPQFA